jgi:hypothetical protein
MAKVLDPLATAYAGAPAREIKPAVARAWKDEFGVELPEPVLSRCAALSALLASNMRPHRLVMVQALV